MNDVLRTQFVSEKAWRDGARLRDAAEFSTCSEAMLGQPFLDHQQPAVVENHISYWEHTDINSQRVPPSWNLPSSYRFSRCARSPVMPEVSYSVLRKSLDSVLTHTIPTHTCFCWCHIRPRTRERVRSALHGVEACRRWLSWRYTTHRLSTNVVSTDTVIWNSSCFKYRTGLTEALGIAFENGDVGYLAGKHLRCSSYIVMLVSYVHCNFSGANVFLT